MGNTYGTHVLLECARVYGGIRRFINVSTDEVYGETSLGKDKGLHEGSVLEPTNPYSAAKAGAEMMAKAYLTSYKLPVIITRGNNVYGPHQFPEKMIPKFTLLASRGASLPIHGDGQSVRSYLFVEDVAAAFETILLKGQVGEVYNIGTQKERSVLSVAADIAKHFGVADPSSARTFVRDRAFNDRRYFICDKKLLGLGWREEVTWEEGLERTIRWYKEIGGKRSYWENGDMDAALAPHPTLQQNGLMRGSASGSGGAGGSLSGSACAGGSVAGAGSLGGGSSSLGGGSGSGSDAGCVVRVPSFIAGGGKAAAAAAATGAAVSLSAAAGAAADALASQAKVV
jgi:UDP-glucose 4,6-dehydratase